ncbi:unnamed protein product [Parajaminaea phylloscopi]
MADSLLIDTLLWDSPPTDSVDPVGSAPAKQDLTAHRPVAGQGHADHDIASAFLTQAIAESCPQGNAAEQSKSLSSPDSFFNFPWSYLETTGDQDSLFAGMTAAPASAPIASHTPRWSFSSAEAKPDHHDRTTALASHAVAHANAAHAKRNSCQASNALPADTSALSVSHQHDAIPSAQAVPRRPSVSSELARTSPSQIAPARHRSSTVVEADAPARPRVQRSRSSRQAPPTQPSPPVDAAASASMRPVQTTTRGSAQGLSMLKRKFSSAGSKAPRSVKSARSESACQGREPRQRPHLPGKAASTVAASQGRFPRARPTHPHAAMTAPPPHMWAALQQQQQQHQQQPGPTPWGAHPGAQQGSPDPAGAAGPTTFGGIPVSWTVRAPWGASYLWPQYGPSGPISPTQPPGPTAGEGPGHPGMPSWPYGWVPGPGMPPPPPGAAPYFGSHPPMSWPAYQQALAAFGKHPAVSAHGDPRAGPHSATGSSSASAPALPASGAFPPWLTGAAPPSATAASEGKPSPSTSQQSSEPQSEPDSVSVRPGSVSGQSAGGLSKRGESASRKAASVTTGLRRAGKDVLPAPAVKLAASATEDDAALRRRSTSSSSLGKSVSILAPESLRPEDDALDTAADCASAVADQLGADALSAGPSNGLPKKDTDRKKRRRQSHNQVERRRRDTINEFIAELATLLPEAMLMDAIAGSQNGGNASKVVKIALLGGEEASVGGEDLDVASGSKGAEARPNKGVILRKSVEYVRALKEMCEHQATHSRFLQDELARMRGMNSGHGTPPTQQQQQQQQPGQQQHQGSPFGTPSLPGMMAPPLYPASCSMGPLPPAPAAPVSAGGITPPGVAGGGGGAQGAHEFWSWLQASQQHHWAAAASMTGSGNHEGDGGDFGESSLGELEEEGEQGEDEDDYEEGPQMPCSTDGGDVVTNCEGGMDGVDEDADEGDAGRQHDGDESDEDASYTLRHAGSHVFPV